MICMSAVLAFPDSNRHISAGSIIIRFMIKGLDACVKLFDVWAKWIGVCGSSGGIS